MNKLSPIIILTVVTANAAPALCQVDISACGVVLDTAGQTYRLIQDLQQTAAAPCIQLAANDVVLDGQGFSIEHGGVGLCLSSGVSGYDVTNIRFVSNGPSGVGTCNGIAAYAAVRTHLGSHSGRLQNNSFLADLATSANYTAIQLTNGLGGTVEVDNNTVDLRNSNNSLNFLVADVTGGNAFLHAHHNVVIMRLPGVGSGAGRRAHAFQVTLGASGFGAEFNDNTLTFGEQSARGDNADPQGFVAWCGGQTTTTTVGVPQFFVHHNTITDYASFSRIMLSDGCDNATFLANNIYLAGTGVSAGIRIRYHSRRAQIVQNTIDASACDDCDGLVQIGDSPSGGCFGAEATDDGGTCYPQDTTIADNNFMVANGSILHYYHRSDNGVVNNNHMSIVGGTGAFQRHSQMQSPTSTEWAHNVLLNNGTGTSFRIGNLPQEGLSYCANKLNAGGQGLGPADFQDGNSSDGQPTFSVAPCACESNGSCSAPAGVRVSGCRGANCAPPMDDGTPPMDDGAPPMNDGAPPMDDGAPPMSDGAPPMNDGAPPMDDGAPPMDGNPAGDQAMGDGDDSGQIGTVPSTTSPGAMQTVGCSCQGGQTAGGLTTWLFLVFLLHRSRRCRRASGLFMLRSKMSISQQSSS